MDPTSRNPDPPLFRLWEAATLTVAVVGASVLLAGYAVLTDLRSAESAFLDRAYRYEREVADQMSSATAVLTALVGLQHASDDMRPHEFEALARELLGAYPHIRAAARLTWIGPEERRAQEAGAGVNGVMRFRVLEKGADGELIPAGRRPVYLPITSLEPLEPALAGWIGYDALADHSLAPAAAATIDRGEAVASDAIELPFDGAGFFTMKATYLGYRTPATMAERRAQANGAVALFIDSRRFFDRIPNPFEETVVRIVGTMSPGPLYRSAIDDRPTISWPLTPFRQALTIQSNGQTFAIEIADRPPPEALRKWLIAAYFLAPSLVGGLAVLAIGVRRRARRRSMADDARLRVSEGRFRDFADATADLFWEMDADLRFTYLSDRFETMSGIPPSSLLGKTREISGLPGVDPEVWRRHLDDLANHRPFRNFVHPRTHPDGRTLWIAVNGKPFFDADGRFLGYRGTGSDITEQFRREQELAEAKSAAEAANRAKSSFLAAMSHELRTPLNAVVGFAEVLKSRLSAPSGDAEGAEFASHIHSSGMHLLSLINDLLDLSKIEAGADTLREGRVDVRNIAQSAERMVGKRAADRRLRLSVDVAADAPAVQGDRRKLLQVLVNLMSNAVKFTKPGGAVALTVRRDAAGDVIFQVKDTGIGIAPEDIPRALAPFVQIDSALSREHDGAGLGLTLTKKLVEQHGGALDLKSTVGVGTTVTVRLPRSRALPALEAERRAS